MPHLLLDRLPALTLADGVVARVATSLNMSIAHVHLAAGARLPRHDHPHEQVVNVVDGELELTVEGQPFRLRRGEVYILPPHIPHSAQAITDCYVIDVFHPVREDFRAASFAGYPQPGDETA